MKKQSTSKAKIVQFAFTPTYTYEEYGSTMDGGGELCVLDDRGRIWKRKAIPPKKNFDPYTYTWERIDEELPNDEQTE